MLQRGRLFRVFCFYFPYVQDIALTYQRISSAANRKNKHVLKVTEDGWVKNNNWRALCKRFRLLLPNKSYIHS